MTSQDMRVELRSDPHLLHAVRGLVRAYAETWDLAADQIDEIILAVDEACANSIRHAYCGRTDGKIDLTLHCTDGELLVTVQDYGIPASAPRLARPIEEHPKLSSVRPGGLGVPLIRKVFNDVEFTTGETQGNCVTMRLNLNRSDERQALP